MNIKKFKSEFYHHVFFLSLICLFMSAPVIGVCITRNPPASPTAVIGACCVFVLSFLGILWSGGKPAE